MKIAVLICTYNRPEYLKKCLLSLKKTLVNGVKLLIVDDASTNPETLKLIKASSADYIIKPQNKGIKDSLCVGMDALKDFDVVITLDSDAIVRNDFLGTMLKLHKMFPDKIITGFHSTTKNSDGSDRHKIIKHGEGWCLKESVGGINMLFTKETWERYAKPQMTEIGNWDHKTSLAAEGIICAVPSVVEHIGIESSLGHTETPDTAHDFKLITLPNVTLVCVDDDLTRATKGIEASLKDIEFGDIQFISPNPKLGSKEAYSRFILKNLHNHIKTDYALIIQYDGYVKNPLAWENEFLNYDYIGAPWWYKDGMNVGNGGFSLRSKRLLELTAKMKIPIYHPEDAVICRTHRKELESKGIRFAPENIASKFSYEGWNQNGSWSGQFGFHGHKSQSFIINQFLGLGDILFLIPLVRKWMNQRHEVIWPIADEYFSIKDYFPDIHFVQKSKFNIDYNNRNEFKFGKYTVKNLRWNKITRIQEAMTSKYSMYGEDFNLWRELKWKRNYEKEKVLVEVVGAKGEYKLICEEFGNVTDGGSSIKKINVTGNKVYLQRVKGFTLLDWAGIIENASEIHAVSSSTLYLFEVLNLKAEEINLYSRKHGQKDFDAVEPIRTKNYKLHI